MKNKSTFWIVTVILSVLVIYTFVCTVGLPVWTKNPLPEAALTQVKEKGENKDKNKAKEAEKEDDVVLADSLSGGNKKAALEKLFELRKQERLLQSRVALANEDSMYLVLDLINQNAILEMKGVALHECKILEYKVSNSIRMYHTEKLLNWIAQPFQMERASATFPKIIFNEKIAPKDTIEAAKAEVVPTAPVQPDVFLVMDFERNLRLVIDQVEKPDEDGQKTISALKWKYKKAEITRSLNSLIRFNREPAMPQINIILPKTDAIILYRALPQRPNMVLVM